MTIDILLKLVYTAACISHGPPTEANAHPHADCRGETVVTHNGIVYLAGLTADDHSATMKAQTEEVLKKIDDLLKVAGTDNVL